MSGPHSRRRHVIWDLYPTHDGPFTASSPQTIAAIHPLFTNQRQLVAAEQIIAWLAEHATTRVGPRGAQVQVPVAEIEAVTRHYTSRAGDPHLHLHLQINSRVFAENIAVRNVEVDVVATGCDVVSDADVLTRQSGCGVRVLDPAGRDEPLTDRGVEVGDLLTGVQHDRRRRPAQDGGYGRFGQDVDPVGLSGMDARPGHRPHPAHHRRRTPHPRRIGGGPASGRDGPHAA